MLKLQIGESVKISRGGSMHNTVLVADSQGVLHFTEILISDQ